MKVAFNIIKLANLSNDAFSLTSLTNVYLQTVLYALSQSYLINPCLHYFIRSEILLLTLRSRSGLNSNYCPGRRVPNLEYSKINSRKSPASGAGNISEPRPMSQVGNSAPSCVRVEQCLPAVRVVERPVFVCLRSSCSHGSELWGGGGGARFVTFVLTVFKKNYGRYGCNPATHLNALPPYVAPRLALNGYSRCVSSGIF
jgi:hypothetical protein